MSVQVPHLRIVQSNLTHQTADQTQRQAGDLILKAFKSYLSEEGWRQSRQHMPKVYIPLEEINIYPLSINTVVIIIILP